MYETETAKAEGDFCVCEVCPRHCRLEKGAVGFCRARVCRDGHSAAENYGRVTSLALDPIEKKPLAMYMPGSMVLSVGSYGCNMKCPFCQNSEISFAGAKNADYSPMTPDEIVSLAVKMKRRGNIGVAYTYNEPLVGYEFVVDTARAVRAANMKNVLVTNGCVAPEIAETVLPLFDAVNIDLKVFSLDGYARLGGSFDAVRSFILAAAKLTHVELTTLIVPGLNDSERMTAEEAKWIASAGRDIPLHITRFFPRHLMSDALPTPVETVYSLAGVAREYLQFVFTGNC